MKFFSVLVCSVFSFSTGFSNASKTLKKNLCPILVFAAGNGHLEHVESIVNNGENVNCEDKYGMRPISSAVKNQHIKIVKYLLEKGAEVDSTELLRWASEYGHVQIAEFLIEKRNADVNGVDKDGRTPLFLAYFKNDYCHPNHDIVGLLIEHGANYNNLIHPTFDFKLHLIELAVFYGDFELVQFLVEYKNVDPCALYNNKTLLQISAESPHGPDHEKIVEFLLSKQTNP